MLWPASPCARHISRRFPGDAQARRRCCRRATPARLLATLRPPVCAGLTTPTITPKGEHMSDEPVRLITRRRSLQLLGGGGLLIAGAGSFAGAALPGSSDANDYVAHAAAACTLTPEQEEGPYYVAVDTVRADIIGGQKGLPFRLEITVANTRTCKPSRAPRWMSGTPTPLACTRTKARRARPVRPGCAACSSPTLTASRSFTGSILATTKAAPRTSTSRSTPAARPTNRQARRGTRRSHGEPLLDRRRQRRGLQAIPLHRRDGPDRTASTGLRLKGPARFAGADEDEQGRQQPQ